MDNAGISEVKINGKKVWSCKRIAQQEDKERIILLNDKCHAVVGKTSMAFVMTLFLIFLSSYIRKH